MLTLDHMQNLRKFGFTYRERKRE